MILKENILLLMDQQDQLIFTFRQYITYSIYHQIIFHTKFAVLILLILHFVHNIMKLDQKIMALFAIVQNLTKVCMCMIVVLLCFFHCKIIFALYKKVTRKTFMNAASYNYCPKFFTTFKPWCFECLNAVVNSIQVYVIIY